MAYLTDEKFDLKDLTTILCGVLPDGNVSFISEANSKQVESVLFTLRDLLAMRCRKRKAEEDTYRIASKAVFSWKTAKAFQENPVFEDDDDSDKMWWEKPELSIEKKMERMKTAERDVKFELSNRRFLLQSKAKTLPYNRPFQRQDRDHGSVQKRPYFPQGRPDTRRCHWCQGVGHIARNCPVKSQQQQHPPRNLLQLDYGKSKNGN